MKSLREICYEYYECWQDMEKFKEMCGGVMPYSSRNDERIRLHEELLEISGLEREQLTKFTNSLDQFKSKLHFYNKVLEVQNAGKD